MVECLPSMVKTLVPGLVPQKDQGGLEPVAGWVSKGRRKKPCGEGSLPRCLQEVVVVLRIQCPFSAFSLCPQDPDPVFTLRGSLEQLVPHTGLTLFCKGRDCLVAVQCRCCPLTSALRGIGIVVTLKLTWPSKTVVSIPDQLTISPSQRVTSSVSLNKEDGLLPKQQPS